MRALVPQAAMMRAAGAHLNLPKAATRTRKKKTSDSEDEDYIAVEDEATSRKKVLKKEYGIAAATKPGMKKGSSKKNSNVKSQSLHSRNNGVHS